jgi:hypothetical protein
LCGAGCRENGSLIHFIMVGESLAAQNNRLVHRSGSILKFSYKLLRKKFNAYSGVLCYDDTGKIARDIFLTL